jgi:hypothetical protein
MVLATILVAQGRQNVWTVVGLVAAVFNPLANLWVIPVTQQMYGDGAIGAAIVTVLTEFVMFAGALYLRPRGVFTRGDIGYMLRVLLATLMMAPAAWLVGKIPSVGVFVATAYGVAIYGAAAYALRLVRGADLATLAAALTREGGVAPAPASGRSGATAQRPAVAAGGPVRVGMQWRPDGLSAKMPAVVPGPLGSADTWVSLVYEYDDADDFGAAVALEETVPVRASMPPAKHAGLHIGQGAANPTAQAAHEFDEDGLPPWLRVRTGPGRGPARHEGGRDGGRDSMG